MASELGWVGLGVSPDFTGFKSQVDRETSKVMGAAGATGGEKFGAAAGRSAGSKFKSAVKSAAKVAAVGLAAVGALAFKFGRDSLEEAREAQKVGALTTSTIKATGGAAKVTAQHVADLSGKISEQAGIDDEVIQRGANMLLTFKNVRNEVGKGSKIFDRTTQAITDMAAGMAGGAGGEIDLKSSSILMGKALNDPVKGLTALNRVGVQFTDQQKAINTALVEGGNVAALNALGFKVTTADFAKAMKDRKLTAEETVRFFAGPMTDAEQKYFDHLAEGGHTLEAQKNILKEVNSQFSGAAAAQATDAEKLQVAWGNFQEEVGTELLPMMDDLTNFLRKKGIPAARDFFTWIKGTGVPAAKHLAEELKPVVGHVKDLAGFLNDLPKEVKIGGLAGVAALFGASKLRGGSGGALGTAGKVLGLAKPVPVFVTNAGGLGAGLPGTGKTPPAVPLGKPPLVGSLPKLAPLIPVGLSSAPGQASPLQQLTGTAPKAPPGTVPVTIDGKTVFMEIDGMPQSAREALNKTAEEFRKAKLPTELKTHIAIYGAPQAKAEIKDLVKQYDLTKTERSTLFRVLGVERAHDQIDNLAGALDDLATNAGNAFDHLGDVALGRGRGGGRPRNAGRDRGRQAALGGRP